MAMAMAISSKRSSSSNEISHHHHRLPEETIEEILIRLPFKSIFRFRCVSKSWFNLIKDSSSIRHHLMEFSDVSFIPLCFIHKSKQNSWFLNLFLFHHDDDDDDDDDDDYEEEEDEEASVNDCLTRFRKGIRRWLDALCDSRKLDAKYPSPVLTFKVPSSSYRPSLKYKSGLKLATHCNGIMCLSHPDFIILVNPLLNEVKTLCNPTDPPRLVGFGFDSIKTMDFKLVRLYCRREAEVYNLKTNVWRKIAFPFAFHKCIKRSTFLNGVIHWCVEASVDGYMFRWKILTFNLANELFEIMDLPLNWNQGLPMCKPKPSIGLFVLNQDSLAFVNYTSSSVGVWTMNKHEETTTWTQLHSIKSLPEPLKKPISFWKKDKLLYETESGRLILYDLLTRRLLSLVFDHSQVNPHNMDYYSKICLEVKAGVLCGSSLVSMNM